ncbi:MAG: hypothetical protein NVSMB47_10040 [Polyangiales bacterium]
MRAHPFGLAAALLLAPACAAEPTVATDVCAQANDVFLRCGVSLPLVQTAACTGAAKTIARCVVDHARECEELAGLTRRLDLCAEDLLDGGDEIGAPDLPVPPPADSGHDARSAHPEGGTTEAGTDAGLFDTPGDGAPDATVDAPSTDTAHGEEK